MSYTYNEGFYGDYEEPATQSNTGIRRKSRNPEDISKYTTYRSAAQNSNAVTQRASRTITTDHEMAAQYQGPIYPDYDSRGKLKSRQQQRVQPERHTEPQRRIDVPVGRRDAITKIAGAGLLTIVAGAVGGSWIASEVDKIGNQFQLGNARACTMELTCGHNDKDHKTLLLFTFMLDRLFMFELPGGDFSKIKTNVTATLESHNIIADPSDINILPSAVPVDGGKFEIHALLRWKPVGVFAKPTDINFLFVDGGGFFRMPVAKK